MRPGQATHLLDVLSRSSAANTVNMRTKPKDRVFKLMTDHCLFYGSPAQNCLYTVIRLMEALYLDHDRPESRSTTIQPKGSRALRICRTEPRKRRGSTVSASQPQVY